MIHHGTDRGGRYHIRFDWRRDNVRITDVDILLREGDFDMVAAERPFNGHVKLVDERKTVGEFTHKDPHLKIQRTLTKCD